MNRWVPGFLLVLLAMVPVSQHAIGEMSPSSGNAIAQARKAIDADSERLISIFKDLHQHPELGFMEERTAAIVAREMRELGYEVETGIGGTGVVAIMRNGEGPVLMYRADMDANAAEEKTGLPYASTLRVENREGVEVPVAHLCGHDAHVTWMLALAKVMAEAKDGWAGTLVLVAQPAEELIEGAAAMVSDGLFTDYRTPKPDYLIAMHTAPILTGAVVSSAGELMAGTEQLDVTIYGQSSHGSMPQYSKDAGLMAAHAVVQYQAIVARVLDPRDTAVITVGAINAGVENNTIPGQAELKLNFRFFDEGVREQLYRGVKAVSEGVARTYGMPEDKMPTIVRKGYSSALVNDGALTSHIAERLVASDVVASENMITEFMPVTGSEDVHMLVEGFEGVKVGFLFVGIASPEAMKRAQAAGVEFPFANHQSTFQVDLEAITHGSKVAAAVVLDLLAKE